MGKWVIANKEELKELKEECHRLKKKEKEMERHNKLVYSLEVSKEKIAQQSRHLNLSKNKNTKLAEELKLYKEKFGELEVAVGGNLVNK